jgi:type IV fimbrial biogenesis protein FimT
MHRWRLLGFTALELLVTMGVVAILLAASVPAFKNYSSNLRMKTAMDSLQTDLNLARGRAISHNIETVICPALGPDDCSGEPDWVNGWIVFTDLNGDRQKQPGEPLFKQAGAVELINISSSRGRSYVRFYPNGTSPGSNISILFCDRRGAGHAGIVAVSNSGRIRMQTTGIEATANCP